MAAPEPVQFMSQMVALEYQVPEATPVGRRFADQLAAGRITGHRCPKCGKVYVPPRGYCPLCVVPTGDADEVDISDRGTVTTFSVITPLQYQGQEEQEDYVQATILLDGADTAAAMQRLEGIPIAEVRSGMRVEAVWVPEAERTVVARGGAQGWLSDAITGWRPTDEPDAPLEQYAEHIL